MRRFSLASLFLLAACGPSSRDAAPAAARTPDANSDAAKVAALPDRQRAGVMLRAIRDAGQDCQNVVAVKAAPGSTPPAWVATCDDKRPWVVAIAADGAATVVDARDAADRRQR